MFEQLVAFAEQLASQALAFLEPSDAAHSSGSAASGGGRGGGHRGRGRGGGRGRKVTQLGDMVDTEEVGLGRRVQGQERGWFCITS